MKGSLMSGVLGLSLTVWMIGQPAAPTVAQDKTAPGWLNDYQAARSVARESGKPIFLVFRCVP